jgi:hypothetical protein
VACVEASTLLAYVDHHGKAYAWAERRRVEAHPKTGAIQIVGVRERVEEIAPRLPLDEPPAPKPKRAPPALFAKLTRENLLGVGVPEDWPADIAAARERMAFLELAPASASRGRCEDLLEYAATGRLRAPTIEKPADPLSHPDTQRRFRLVENLRNCRRRSIIPGRTGRSFSTPLSALSSKPTSRGRHKS